MLNICVYLPSYSTELYCVSGIVQFLRLECDDEGQITAHVISRPVGKTPMAAEHVEHNKIIQGEEAAARLLRR